MSFCCNNFLCRFISFVVSAAFIIIVVLGAAALAIYVKYHPKLPSYDVEAVDIPSISFVPIPTPSNVGDYYDGYLSMDTIFLLKAVNPNKKIAISYLAVKVKMDYFGFPIATGVVPPFYQGPQNATYTGVELIATSLELPHSVSQNLTTAVSQGLFIFNVKVSAKVKIIVQIIKSPAFWVHVNCVVGISPPGGPGGVQLLSKICKVAP